MSGDSIGADETHLLSLVREARPQLDRTGAEAEHWLLRLEEHHLALQDLVERKLRTDPPTGCELAAGLWRFWWQRGRMAEGRDLLQKAAAIGSSEQVQVLKGLGTIAFRQGDTDAAERAFVQRLELIGEDGRAGERADALADLARIALRRGNVAAVRDYADRGYAAAQGLDPEVLRIPLHMRAAAARMEGRLDEARALYLESRALNDRLGNRLMVASEDHNLVHVALRSGDRQEAGQRFQASSSWIFANQNAYLRPYALVDAGVLALYDGDAERAARLIASAQRTFEQTGAIPDPDDRVELDDAVIRLREQLGQGFERAWRAGSALTVDEAVALARSVRA